MIGILLPLPNALEETLRTGGVCRRLNSLVLTSLTTLLNQQRIESFGDYPFRRPFQVNIPVEQYRVELVIRGK